MAFCRLVFPLLVLSVICINASKVPVYIWGDIPKTSIKSSPLTTVSSPDFEGILKQELANDPLTILFIEETLSVEDFSRRNSDGETAFPYLQHNVREAIYLPSVENALRALNEIASKSESDNIKLTENGLSEEIAPKGHQSGKFVFINLRDAKEGESRVDMLQRHDEFMQNTLDEMKKPNEKVVAIYTAQYPSWVIPVTHSRPRREVTAKNTTDNETLYVMDHLRLYSSTIHVTTGNDTYPLDGFTTSTTTYDEGNKTIATKMNFANASLTLNFNQKAGYWFFETVNLEAQSIPEETLYPVEEVFAIVGFSYRCLETVSFMNRNESKFYKVSFKDMKVQPFINETQLFGDSFNCVGFFSAPIWAGLFVVFILLLITFYGIMMMLDIRTMDRFDDPKGKTITINAGE